jgi:plasmid stabilization system protein ParE
VTLHFHRKVQTDLRLALEYFDREGGTSLGDRFFAEVEATKDRVAANPTSFGFFKEDIRRARLRVFRYHFLFRIVADEVRILVLRHNRRHPEFGLSRR